MTLGEKLWINKSVFEQSLYYEEMPGGREPAPVRQAAEPAVQQERQSAPAQADEPARTDSSPSRRQDQRQAVVTREIVREQQVVTVQPQLQQKGGSVRELSDELERLSQRYGSSMEDWLYDNLRFKEYTFRHNPRSLTVRSRRLTVQVSCFGLGQALQELGPGLTEVEGEGELFGTDAMEQFLALRQLQEQGGSGILSGAGLEPMRAVFDSLEMTGTGGDGAIGYRVHFIEDRG